MKALMIATVAKKHIVQFHIPYLKLLQEMGYETYVAAKNDFEDGRQCIIPYCDKYYDVPFERSPWRVGNLRAYRMLKDIMTKNDFTIIHCHTPVGSVLGRLAAKAAGNENSKIIYTAHGFHFYKGAPFFNWLVYYPVEKYLSKYTDVLITMNREDYMRAKRKLAARKTVYVPGVGVDLNKFNRDGKIRLRMRKALGLKEDDFAILCVGELTKRKNQQLLIRAVAAMRDKKNVKCLIAGNGKMEGQLKQIVKDAHIEANVIFLGYREDIPELLNAADLFVFMTKQEGLPVALMEAMACEAPVFCSDVRGNRDLIEDGRNGRCLSKEYRNAEKLAELIGSVKNNPQSLRNYAQEAKKQIYKYGSGHVLRIMKTIYEAV